VLEIGRDVLRQKLHGYLERDPRLRSVAEYTKGRFEAATVLTAHNWEHIYRDILNAIAIGEAEDANMDIVLPAIVVHDIGYLYGAARDHGPRGATKLREYLDTAGISYPADEVAKLASCIRTHKGSGWDQHPEGLEARVVADADLLDKFGALGTYQHVRACSEFNWSLAKILEYNETMIGLTLDTDTGKRLAEPGRKLIVDFLRELAREAEPDLAAREKLRGYLDRDPRLQSVVDYTKERFAAATALTAHNWEHIYRDTLNAILIGEAEGADIDIVLPATVMHDIGYLYGAGKEHGSVGAVKLPEYLDEAGISFSADEVAKLASCIRTHKGSGWGEHPESLEAKVVADADVLDKFGAIGTYQQIRAWTEFNWPLAKIVRFSTGTITGLALDTATGRRLAEPGRQLIIDFYRELAREAEPYLDPSL
jgi:uncharacterized protein